MSEQPRTFRLYPWLKEAWDQIQQIRREDRLPHALLLTGGEGMGKRRFAEALAHSLLCESPDETGVPCGQCRGCQLFRVGNHPDFQQIVPEEEGKEIRIDAIREFIGKEGLTSHAGGYKLVLIEPADRMNRYAANSLLKTLEEPVARTLMILITARPTYLPATIRSRCQQFALPSPKEEVALQWLTGQLNDGDPKVLLHLANGAPLHALRLADPEILSRRRQMLKEFLALLEQREDPIAVAGRWEKDPAQSVQWLAGWIQDMLRLSAAPEPPFLTNPDQKETLQALAERLDTSRLHQMMSRTLEVNRALDSTLNMRLVLESLLLDFTASKVA